MYKRMTIIILVILSCTYLFGESKAETYSKELKENPYKFEEMNLPDLDDVKENPVNLDFVREKQGYYIQNHKRFFQDKNRSPIIFKLYEEKGILYLAQIDVKNGAEVILSKTELIQSGNFVQTADFHYRLATDVSSGTGLYIFDSVANWETKWAFRWPFTYQTDLNGLLDCIPIMKMTSDYLKKFAGKYEIESSINHEEGSYSVTPEPPATNLDIIYDEENKALKWSKITFIETDSTEPFYWIFGEGAGFVENIYVFVDNGVLYSSRESTYNISDDTSGYVEICSYYKRSMSESYKPNRKTLSNLRIRKSPELNAENVLISVKNDSELLITEIGKPDYIDRIIGNWVKVTVKAGTPDKDGNPIPKEISGWCFDGYLSK